MASSNPPQLLALKPDNFTDLARTPWAGRLLSVGIKQSVCGAETPIGESWEFSVDPDYPSRLMENDQLLSEWVTAHGAPFLGDCAEIELLIKILNPDFTLSLQVHPEDDDPNLSSDECGKPESWLVLEAEPGAGIYIGFKPGVTHAAVKNSLETGEGVESLLNFVEVTQGEYFEIQPGVAHAIGPGVVLLEPQRTLSGKKGKTYRMWDWDRRYDDNGAVDANGQPRPLHVDQALAIIDPEAHQGPEFMQRVRRYPVTGGNDAVLVDSYPANQYYQSHFLRWRSQGQLGLVVDHTYSVLTVLKGAVHCHGQLLPKGQTVVLRANQESHLLEAEPGSEATLVHPAQGNLRYQ